MTDRFNTIAGWTLFAGIVALGLSIVSGMYFEGDRPHRPHELGYVIDVPDVVTGDPNEPPLATFLASGNAAAGAEAFGGRCGQCHTIEQGGATLQGPNLFGVIGKPIGRHAAGFAYSSDLAEHGGEWSYENLDAWLKSPKAFASNTKMTFPGFSNPQDRANMILYMRENGGGPALPEPPVAEPAEGEAAAVDDGAGPAGEPGQDAAGAVAMPEQTAE
jgi:cytochrome c